MSIIREMLTNWLAAKWVESLSKDHREDPVYKKNLRDSIERNRQFENAE